MTSTTPNYHTTVEPGRSTLAAVLAAGRIPGIDFMRTLAVLGVMSYHAGFVIIGIGHQALLFFSGFLITWLLLEEQKRSKSIDVLSFYRRRATRLLPALYAYIVLGAVLLALMHKEIPWAMMAASVFNVLNYAQAFNGAPSNYLAHTWSLSLQEQFYLLWPVLLVAAVRRGIRLEKVVIGAILAVWVYRAVAYLVFDARDEYLYRAMETRCDNLAVGGLLAVLLRNPRAVDVWERLRRHGVWIVLALVICIQISMRLSIHSMFYKYVVGFAVDPLFYLLMVPFVIQAAMGNGLLGRAMRSRFMQRTGQASYAMYLLHPLLTYPVISRLTAKGMPLGVAFLISAVLVFIISHLSFTYFETPVRKWLDSRLSRGAVRARFA